MRILAIRLQNLNSLRGPHELRFDRPPLAGCGVFLIAGPTGAGKSTLLDALTLALYGRAARYGKSSPDEMISRHTGESLAEVEFESQGRAYRAVWRMRRARGRADGKLQPVERRLIALPDAVVLAEKAGEVEARIEALTGLTYDRFMRSVLLAQGQFAAFLNARPAERADLLEQITGTDIYSVLSQRAHTEYAARQQGVDLLKRQIASRPILTREVRVDEERLLADARAAVADVTTRVREARIRAEQIEKQRAAQNEAVRVRQAATDLAVATAAAATRSAAHRQVVAAAVESASQATAARVSREMVWQEVVRLDAIGQSLAAAAAATAATLEKLRAEATATRSAEERATETLRQSRQAAAADKAWLAGHAVDAGLADHLPALRDAAESWRDASAALAQAAATIQEAAEWERTAAVAAAAASRMEAELADARIRHREAVAGVDAAMSRREAQRIVVEKALRVQGLDDHRQELVAGEACPLCGATEHPWAMVASGPPADWQAGAARQALSAVESTLAAGQKEATALVHAIGQLEARVAAERSVETSARHRLAALAPPDGPAMAAIRQRDADCGRRVCEGMARWGLAADQSSEIAAGLATLQQRDRLFADTLRRDLDAEKVIALAVAVQKAAAIESGRLTTAVQEAELAAAAAARAALTNRDQRRALFGEAAVDDDRARSERTIRAAQAALETARQREMELTSELNDLHTRLRQADERKVALDAEWAGHPPVTDEARRLAGERVRALEAELTARSEEVGRRGQRLQADDEMRSVIEADTRDLAVAETDLARWGRLRELIGSGDGSKFSRFAQSLTLRQLVLRANHHLARLSPRYRLIGAEGEGLDLRIVDLFQANADRPMESLSGGESFLASLALALGLSELASRHHPIDSLFIDEGFGTLDAETLEVALTALENLQAGGKTIGLISHVELLKERLATQVQVVREPGGTSRVVVEG